MFKTSLAEAFKEATPEACRKLLGEGIRFAVAVENADGRWFVLFSSKQEHAHNLARHWVDTMKARGASCWRIYDDGIAHEPFVLVSPDYWDYEEE